MLTPTGPNPEHAPSQRPPNVVPFPGTRRQPTPVAAPQPKRVPPVPQRQNILDQADLAVLIDWMRTAPHGYARLHIERSSHAEGSVCGSFALLYPPGSVWSAWGIARADDGIEIWRCATGRTLGRFATMAAALNEVPPATAPRAPASSRANG